MASKKGDPYAHMVRYTVASDFETIRDQVKDAITDRGMVINNVSHIGNMLERTRKDLGVGEKIYLHAEALEFCKQEDIYMYKKKIAIMYGNDTISEKYASLIVELSSRCNQINKFSVLREARDWAIN